MSKKNISRHTGHKNTSDYYCVSGIDHCTHVVDGCARGTKENSEYTLAVVCVRAPPPPPPRRAVPRTAERHRGHGYYHTRAEQKQ